MTKISDTHYAKYIRDREGLEILESDDGFIIYKINPGECFIANMYLDPSSRGSGRCREMIERIGEIALSNECKALTGHIHLFDKNAEITVMAALNCGFNLAMAHNGIIGIKKNLES